MANDDYFLESDYERDDYEEEEPFDPIVYQRKKDEYNQQQHAKNWQNKKDMLEAMD